jgi:hypothetical protein
MQLRIEYFITTLFLTMFILYLMYPKPEVIIKHPSPEQNISDVYVDDNNVCYRYHRKEIKLE